MRALQVLNHDTPPQFQTLEVANPLPHEVQIEIKACSLNFADLLMIKGTYQDTPNPPFTLGLELAGRVVKCGEDVHRFAVGDRVCAFTGHGGLAQQGNFDAGRVFALPDGISYEVGASVLIAYGTSHLALFERGKLSKGERVLILGAAGGVGLTAVELAHHAGAEVVACARGASKLEIASAAGADQVIDSETPDLAKAFKDLGGVDVVYDAVGGQIGQDALRALRVGGRYLVIGFASGDVPQLKANHLLVKNITLHGFYWGGYIHYAPEVLKNSISELFAAIEFGDLSPHISHSLPFDESLEALELLKNRKSTGKIVLRM